MNSQQLWSSLKKKHSWPNLEDSIGQFYGEKQGRLCWRAQGPAREAFSEVAPKIKEYLNSCSDAVPGSDWVTWSIYMIGRSKSTAVPTIMFECFQKGPRKEAMDMIRESGILRQYPGMETGHWSFPPNIVFPQQFTSTSGPDETTSVDSDLSLGRQITVKIDSNGSIEYRKATVGGIFQMHGRSYYFTVNHPFTSGHQVVPWPSSLGDYDDECEFGGQSDADDDEALMEVTSRGSRTPDSSSGCNLDDDTPINDSLESSKSEDACIRCTELQDKMKNTGNDTFSDEKAMCALTAEDSSDFEPEDEPIFREEGPGPVAVSPQDLYITSTVLDYALILCGEEVHLQDSNDVSLPLSINEVPFLRLDAIAESIPENASIFTRTGSSGLITGTLCGSPSYTRLPGARSYQEVFTVKLDGRLHPGDCGSCVFSIEKGTLYGHIVGGSTVTQVAYMIPAAHVFLNIASRVDEVDESASTSKANPMQVPVQDGKPQEGSFPSSPTSPPLLTSVDPEELFYPYQALKPVRFVRFPVETEGSLAAYKFEKHAQTCSNCHDAAGVDRLCAPGYYIAKDLVKTLTSDTLHEGIESTSTQDSIEIPSEFTLVKKLLKMINRSYKPSIPHTAKRSGQQYRAVKSEKGPVIHNSGGQSSSCSSWSSGNTGYYQ